MWTTRIFGGALVALGLAILVGDLSAEGPFRLRVVGEVWYAISPGTLNLTQAVIERYVAEWLWNPVALTLLLWPAAAVCCGAGAGLTTVGEIVGRFRPPSRRGFRRSRIRRF